MSLLDLMVINLGLAVSVMLLGWVVHLLLGKASVVDSFWGPGFAVIAWFTWYWQAGDPKRSLLLAILVSIWALRLALHITARSIGEPEDRRYAAMRAKRPETFWFSSLYIVFLLQAAIMWVISMPVQLGMQPSSYEGLTVLDFLGLGVWCVGFYFEAIGDLQLKRFKSDPNNKGKTLDTGLWRYTRHPNYFGETVMWWGIFLIACSSDYGYFSFIGPLVLTLLLLKVSGVTLTEKMMSKNHRDLSDYKRRTSAFIPMPPKKVEK